MGTATFPEIETAEQLQTEKKLAPRYHLILFDDDDHTYAYVVEMMMNLFALTPDQAFDIAYTVDHIGQAVVKTCGLEEAAQGKEAILNYGADSRRANSRGSMSAIVQKAED